MSESNETALTGHQRHLLEHIRACEASGKRITAYCAEQGLSVRSMYDCRKVLVSKGILPRRGQSRFQRVKVAPPSAGSDWEIQLPNGVSVSFSGSVDERALRQVLNTAAHLE